MGRILAVAMLLFCSVASAADGPKHGRVRVLAAINNLGMNASRSFALPSQSGDGFALLVMYVKYTYANSGTITLTCTASQDNNTNDYSMQYCTLSGGTCALGDSGIFTKAVSASAKFVARLDILGYRDTECTIVHSAGNSSDKVTIDYELITQ